MTVYARLDAAGTRVLYLLGRRDAEGVEPMPPPDDGCIYRQIPDLVPMSGPMPTSVLEWRDGALVWIDPRTLAEARADKVAELSAACAVHILGGFVSSALGADYTYPSTILDQHNLNCLVTRSLYQGNPPAWVEKFWCADSNGVWERREHTALQLQQVGDEAIARITAAQAQCDGLVAAAAVATLKQLPDIVWVAE